MQLSFRPLLLELRHPFRLAIGSRTHTQVVLTEIKWRGLVGYGEAAMPPYYGENHETAAAFLNRAAVPLAQYATFSELNDDAIAEIMAQIDGLAPGNHAAKAAVDIALHDLWGKMAEQPLWQLWDLPLENMPLSSFTLGIDTPAVLRDKMRESADFQIIKIKLGSENDREIIQTIRQITDKPIYADANQGWKNKEQALELAHWLAEQNVLLIEQPFAKDDLDSSAWLSERSPLPILADESFQRLPDLDRVLDSFHGVNIKLMKCTGLSEARRIARNVREKGKPYMVGCMTETSCGILAAALLCPESRFADIDGCWLIRNNPFEMPELKWGRIQLGNRAGLGLLPNVGEV